MAVSEPLPAWARYLLLGAFAALVLPLGAYAVYANVVGGGRISERIQRELLDPYGEDLAAQRWDEAHRRWTAQGRERHELDAFTAAHSAHRAELGPPRALDVRSVSETHEPGRPTYYRTRVIWQGALREQSVAYDIREVDGRLRIDRAYERPAAGNRVPAVY